MCTVAGLEPGLANKWRTETPYIVSRLSKGPAYGIPVFTPEQRHRYDKGVPRPSEKAGLC
jgi:hypothetical protein